MTRISRVEKRDVRVGSKSQESLESGEESRVVRVGAGVTSRSKESLESRIGVKSRE